MGIVLFVVSCHEWKRECYFDTLPHRHYVVSLRIKRLMFGEWVLRSADAVRLNETGFSTRWPRGYEEVHSSPAHFSFVSNGTWRQTRVVQTEHVGVAEM